MAKSTGLGAAVAIDDSAGTPRTISNDIDSFDLSTPRNLQDITGVDKSAMERLAVLVDGKVTINGFFNPAATPSSHAVFSTVPSTSVNRTSSFTIQAKVLAMEILYSDYQFKRGTNGDASFSAPGELADGTVPTWA